MLLSFLISISIVSYQVYQWTADPNQFVEDEDDDTFSYSVRISAQDLLLVSIFCHFHDETIHPRAANTALVKNYLDP